MNSVFDNDKRYIKMLLIKYSIFTFIGLIVFLALGLLITKKYYYQNVITFENEEKAYIFVEKNYLEMVKKQNKLIIDDITYDYNIERIEDKNKMYLVEIKFTIPVKIENNVYKIMLEHESIIKYILRTIRGGLWKKCKMKN